MRRGRVQRVVAAVVVAAMALLPSVAGAFSVSTGNGRAEERDRASVLPGEARTEARLLQLRLGNAVDRGQFRAELGQITAEAAKAGGLFSELLIEGVNLAEHSFPTVAFHSDAEEETRQENDDLTITVKENGLDSSLALANWTLRSGATEGAVSRLDLLSGTVTVPGVGMKANLGERGFISQVTRDAAHARFAITLEDFAISLGSVLPDTPLPLGTSLDIITRLDIPLGDTLNTHVARVARLVDDLALVDKTLDDLDAARKALRGLVSDSPVVQAALAAVEAAEAAVAKAASDLVVASANVDAARMAANTADAAAAAADAAVAAAQRDVATATAKVTSIQSTIDGLDADIAALEQELASTLDPVRLAQIPGEIAAKATSRDAAQADLASAEAARASAASVLSATETSAVVKRGAAATARAGLSAAESAVASATAAAEDAADALSKAVSGADAAVAAAAAADLAVATAAEQAAALEARLRTLLQAVSDLLEGMPPLPVLEQELDEALRAAPIVSIGGLALETTVTASPAGSSNLVHCKVERVTVLGLSPEVEECTDLIAMEKEAVRQVNELLQSLGAVGVQGVQLLGPGGTWTEPGPVGPDGKARSEGQMAALTLSIPEVSLDGVAANLLAKVGPILEAIKSRPASAIIVPTIRPADGSTYRMMAASGPQMEAGSRTLGDQIQQVSDELGKVHTPDELQNLSTGSVHAVVAQAKTVAEYDTTRMDDQNTSDPTSVCGGDPVCLAQCAAGNCPGSAAGDDPASAGGGRGSGSDSVGLPWSGDANGAKLPVTGAAGGLTAVAMLALGGAGAGWLRRRPRP